MYVAQVFQSEKISSALQRFILLELKHFNRDLFTQVFL